MIAIILNIFFLIMYAGYLKNYYTNYAYDSIFFIILINTVYILKLRRDKKILMDNINEEFIRASKANNNSIIDPLTGIYNRRHFDAVLDKIYSENNDDGALSIMIIDIDHFKKFNDTYGHDVGDEVLKTVVNTVRKNIRHNLDMFFRFGGEEFIIITSDDKDGSLKLAEKLNKLEYKAVERVTISIGVAVYQKGISKTELIKIADNNLYRAKENGRNQVVY
ncbi:MAG: GGDEF domain-containing protein [Deltaproteobacteria bacterium]|nr:GGDEF domain-containing protein [Deltaproteobacteria bacterium]